MDSDSDPSSDSDLEVDNRVAELEEKLLESPYSYEDHVELIGLLRQQGDLGKAREARQSMSKLFPLTEELWLEWLSDEVPLCGLQSEEIASTQQLFESATRDYLSVMVWLQYTQFAIDKLSAVPEGLSFPRDVFERAIVGCGLHVAQAGLIWDSYVTLETAILNSLQQSSSDEGALEARQLVESQKERVHKLYKRRLSVPHIGMEKALEQYVSTFPECGITESSVAGYSRAKSRLDEYLPFESSLLLADPPPLDCYRSYLDHLISSKGDPFLINNLYQRAVAHHSLDIQLWKDYLAFLDSHFSTAGSVLVSGYHLAVRSIPWEVSFWLGLVTGLERNNNSHETIVDAFESSLTDTFSEARDYLTMWTAYVDYYRRRMASDEEAAESGAGVKRAELMEMFTRARNNLKTDFGIDGDPRDMLSRYHANMTTDAAEGRGIWDNIMTRHGREAQYWIDYIAYIRSRQSENCRRFYQQAVNSVTDDPGRVCEAYLQFEREEGTLESYETAVKRTKAQMDRIKEREVAAAEKGSQKRDQPWWKEKEQPKGPPSRDRRRDGSKSHLKPQQQPAGKKKQSKVQGKKDVSGKAVKQSGEAAREGQRKRKAAVMEDTDGSNGMEARKQPRVGDQEDGTTSNIQPPPAQKREEPAVVSMDTSAAQVVSQRPHPGGRNYERTVFVSNLPPAITEDQLKDHFKQCGDIVEVRLIRSKKGPRVNTFAYIEFLESPAVWKALNLDRCYLLDRNIYVSPFKEQGGGGGGGGDRSGARPARSYDNSCTVYVNNLQRDVTEDALLEIFKQCGEVKEIRLVKGKNGRPKGYAYVEYKDKVSAQEAVKQLDSHQLGLKQIGVAMSAPKKPADGQSVPEGVVKSEGQGKSSENSDGGFLKPTFIPRRVVQEPDDAPVPRKSKSKLMLVPRAVAKGGGGGGDKEQEPSSKGKLSNDDFRKLFSSSKPT